MKPTKRFFVLVFFALLAVGQTRAQFGITPMLPPDGIFLKTQLWNFSVSSTSATSVQGQVQLSVKPLQSRDAILTATSAPFEIQTGVRAVQYQALQPIAYSYNTLGIDQSPGGLLPAGTYQVCYQLLVKTRETTVVAAEACVDINIQPMGPPVLVTPEDTSLVTGTTPAFSWVPPSPAGMLTGMTYDLILSEIHKGQSVTDAIQYNIPVQQATSLRQPFWTPTIQGPGIEPGKRYAWQVVVRSQTGYADKSEVWSFHTADSLRTQPDSGAVYLLLDDRLNGFYQVAAGLLHVKYYSTALPHKVTVTITDANGAHAARFRRYLQEGDNYLDFDVSAICKKGQAYNLTLTDQGNTIHNAHFTIQ